MASVSDRGFDDGRLPSENYHLISNESVLPLPVNTTKGGRIMLTKAKKAWELSGRDVTPESVYLNRRRFLRQLGLFSLAGPLLLNGCSDDIRYKDLAVPESVTEKDAIIHNYDPGTLDLYPALTNDRYTGGRALTDEKTAATYNNFYEFSTIKERVFQLVDSFQPHPWTVEVAGLVKKPQVYDVDELIRTFTLEERVYRLRCVEAWAMTVPWTGFSVRKLIDHVEPLSQAKFIRFISFDRPKEAPGQASGYYVWPYYEGLRMEEAVNELAFMASGIYGHPLPKQHGAPLRLVVPWKYGYKSIKSITRIEFVADQPPTFWSDLYPARYPFTSNVDPNITRQPWSQKNETLIDTREVVPTQIYNGYGEFVASLYQNSSTA